MDPNGGGVVLPLALFYGGIAQFAAGMWEYKAQNTFGATAFATYGAFWMSFAAFQWFFVPQLVAAGVDPRGPTGLFLLSWLVFTAYMTVAASSSSSSLRAAPAPGLRAARGGRRRRRVSEVGGRERGVTA